LGEDDDFVPAFENLLQVLLEALELGIARQQQPLQPQETTSLSA
jgi:hypothetical protein